MAKKINVSLRSALFLGAATAAALSVTAPGFGQAAETVIITGTRIQQQGVASASPVTSVGQTEIKFQGATNVESLLNSLPATVADLTNQGSNGATGQATVDLRGLGSSRTLVLVDGKRLMPSDPSNPVADLNQVPAALVDHIEVLTGGASAVYGSDAEAGVVNFIMRKDFEGIEANVQFSINQADNSSSRWRGLQDAAGMQKAPENYWGGRTIDTTVLFGVNTPDNKGNITGYIGYRTTSPVTQAKRDFSACSIAVKTNGFACSGSSNYNRWISIDNASAGQNYDFFQTGTGKAGSGAFVDFDGSPQQRYNYGALNYIQRPDTRYIGGFDGHYRAAPWAEVYTSFMFSDDHTYAQIAPSGVFIGTGRNVLPTAPAGTSPSYVEVNCANPLMSAQENALLCGQIVPTAAYTDKKNPAVATLWDEYGADGPYGNGYDALVGGRWNGAGNIYSGSTTAQIGRRNLEGGARSDDLRHTAYRLVLGTKGEIGSGWAYDISGQYGITLYSENYRNEFSVSRVQNALNVNPATGNCFAKDYGIDTTCVPLNIFDGNGSITKAQLDYVAAQGFKSGSTEEYVINGSLNGDLGQYGVKSPWAHDGVGVAAGFEYRKEALELQTSRDFQLNDLYGQGGASLPVPKSAFSVVEGFGEVQVPVIQGKEYAEDLSFNGGFRYSSYSTAGTTWTYKTGAQYKPTEDVALRGSYERAVRAPNVLELFAPANIVLFQGADPCSKATGTVLANCDAMGVNQSLPLAAPSGQYNQQALGNLNLKPENSYTYSAGVVLTPSFLSNFTMTIDYYSIKVKDYIGSVNPNTTLAGCYGLQASATSKALTCPLIHRGNGGTGPLYGAGFVSAQTINTGFLRTSGVDFEANYFTGLEALGLGEGAGSVSLNFVGTFLDQLVTNPVESLGSYDCAGKFGVTCGQPAPQWRHKMRITWEAPWDFQVSLMWRHLSSAKFDQNTGNWLLNGACGTSHVACPDPYDAHIASFDYFDLAGSWDVSKGIQLRAGINNLFGKNAPVVDANTYSVSGPPYGNGNTYPGVYDSLGRTLYVAVTAKL